MTTRLHRVLLIAEAANPEWVSVPLIGWSLSTALAKVTHAHIVTHIRNRAALLRAGLVEGRDFTAIDNEYVARPVWKMAGKLRGGAGNGWTTLAAFSSLSYYAFEYAVWQQLGKRITEREFDIVHRITPVSPSHQSLIARRLTKNKVPFVIGPLNGGVPWPKGFVDRQHAEREWLSHVRGLFKLMPAYRSMRRDSAAILVGSKHVRSEVPRWAQSKCVYIPENGIDPLRFSVTRSRSASLPLQAAFVGRLVPLKCVDVLLEAAAEFLRAGVLQLHIVGDGPQRALLESMADRLGVRSNIVFRGWVPHAEVQKILQDCDFLALPSVREFGGGVVLESMALGVTPIVADYGGPAELVDDKTGIRVKFDDKASLVAGFARTIADLIRAPQVLDRLGSAGIQKVRRTLTWEAKANQILSVYNAVLSGQRDLTSLSYN